MFRLKDRIPYYIALPFALKYKPSGRAYCEYCTAYRFLSLAVLGVKGEAV